MTTVPRPRDTGEVDLLQAVMNRSQGGCYICHWPIDIDAARRQDLMKGFELREARFRMLARKPFGPPLLRFVAVCPDCEESHLLAKAEVETFEHIDPLTGKVVRRDFHVL